MSHCTCRQSNDSHLKKSCLDNSDSPLSERPPIMASMPLDETPGGISTNPPARSNGDPGVERSPQITGEAMLLKELVAELRALNENLGQFRHYRDLGDQLPRLRSLLGSHTPKQPHQQHAGLEDGVGQDREAASEVGESEEPARDSAQQQPPLENEVNENETGTGRARESSALDRPGEGLLAGNNGDPESGTSQHMTYEAVVEEEAVTQVKTLSDSRDEEPSEADQSSFESSCSGLDPPRQEGAEKLDIFPSPEFLLSIRQFLEGAVDPCRCYEAPQLKDHDLILELRRREHHEFQDAVLLVPSSSSPTSGLMEFKLHSTTDPATPRDLGQVNSCRDFITTSWPRHPVHSAELSWGNTRPMSSVPEQGEFWYFIGANHHCITNVKFYVRFAEDQPLLTVPRLVYAIGATQPGVPYMVQKDMDCGECHPNMARPRGRDDVQLGQVWYAAN
ncbi:hypothetical protein B0I37DRAFT_384412 [Chaetomium sp. MPI-CAGE-AT-0009]|nr:hypothetical protein B0I37DRAFT_384412 [Chaetomium sp. MPI-CAGE-AT-0009]